MSLRDAIALNGQPLDRADLVSDNFFEWQPVEVTCVPQPRIVSAHLHIGADDLGAPAVSFGDPIWRWRWSPRDAVGVFEARLVLISDDGTTTEELFRVRIRPRTIDSENYEALIAAVQQDAAALVYALHGGAEGVSLNDDARPRSLLEDYFLLVEQLAPAALTLTNEIASLPQHVLRSRRVRLPLGDVDRMDGTALATFAQTPLDAGTYAVETTMYSGPLPETITAQRSVASVDLIEHRLLKGIVQTIHWRLGVVRGALAQEVNRRERNDAIRGTTTADVAQARLRECAVMQRAVRAALASPLLREIPPLYVLNEPTHLMRRSARYRRLRELYRSLRHTALIDWDCPLLWLPIQSLPLLYEQWCVLQVIKALRALGTVTEQHILTSEATGERLRWTLRLRQNTPLLTVRRDDGSQLRLFYQRRYGPRPSSDTVLGSLDPFVRIPDIAIEATYAGGSIKVLLLDAKYRIAPDGGVPQDALDDAYAYRNAIGKGGKRATLGAFLLYPGSERIDAADRVGAQPLLPTVNEQLTLIEELIGEGNRFQ